MHTIRYARTRIRVARLSLGRLEPRILTRPTLTIYPRHAGGKVGR